MNKKIILSFIIFALCLTDTGRAKEPIKIVTTIGQITDVTKIIGGERVNVEGLMGPGVDPHLYKATESDVTKLAEADIIFYNGLFLEAKMEPIFKRLERNKLIVAVSDDIPRDLLLDSETFSGHYDPHIWFDVTLWIKIVRKITETLIASDPVFREEYESRANQYMTKLLYLDNYVKTRAEEVPELQRVLVTAHDAFRYFGRKYGFEVVGLQGVSTESEAGARDVRELADFITKRKIKAIFIESSVPERNIKAVQEAVRARNWNVKIGGELFSDAMGDAGTPKGTYVGMVTHNIDTIVDALKIDKDEIIEMEQKR